MVYHIPYMHLIVCTTTTTSTIIELLAKVRVTIYDSSTPYSVVLVRLRKVDIGETQITQPILPHSRPR
jgi:hypothetical protein